MRLRYEAYTDASLGTLVASEEAPAKSGWAVGAGIDYAADDRWVIRAEYLHYDFGKYWSRTLAAAIFNMLSRASMSAASR
jgi:opacity protein-like surface antigen